MNYQNYIQVDYSELSQLQKDDPIFVFLAHFNAIDKFFDKLLKQDKFLPYNEKIKRVATGEYYVSWFVKLHQYQLKYFGELRNHITHGIKMDGKTYAVPTEYAINKIERFKDAILNPPSCFEIFGGYVFACKKNDYLKDILPIMKQNNYTHIPVYNGKGKFTGVLTEKSIAYWLAENFDQTDDLTLDGVKVSGIPLDDIEGKDYAFVSKHNNIYQIDQIFTNKRKNKERLWVIFITEDGDPDQQIEGIVTSWDVALVDDYVIH